MEICVSYILTVLFLIIFFVYKYLTRNNGYWKSRGIPEAAGGVFLFGHAWDQLTLQKNIAMIADDLYKAHPHDSMVGIYEAQLPVLFIKHPDLIKFVLSSGFAYFSENPTLDKKTDPLLSYDPFFQNGQHWKDARGIFISAYSSKKLKERIPAIKNTCEKMVNYLNAKISQTGSLEIEGKQLYSRYTCDVAAGSVYSIDGHNFDDQEDPRSLRSMMNTLFGQSKEAGFKQNLLFAFPALHKWISTGFVPKWINESFIKMVNEVKSYRSRDMTPRNDILQHVDEYLKEKGMDKEELAAHTFGFFVEQYETSSLALSHMTYYAAKYPRIQEKMKEEVEQVFQKHSNLCSYEAINDMTYIEQVVKETLRLLPPLGALLRKVSKPVTLTGPDGLTCNLKPGDEVHLAIWPLHRDPQYWENPEEFMPERFEKEYEDKRNKYIYIPFGEGQRMCPGLRMAFFQVKAAMATMVKNYVFELSPKMKEPIRLNPRYFMNIINGGVWVYLKPRV